MLPSRPQILPKKRVAGGKRFDNLYGRRRLRHVDVDSFYCDNL
ncbi:hypothetical protein T10_5419 [Trichinella papuae]|uniref:Uncharacterized protein n=1 Tax=Trichinella papuae TaxID=268474 RepID=A0A0V1LZ71_9BILA|nr:hypothetical protein T10_5419 [Trichinella papuae]